MRHALHPIQFEAVEERDWDQRKKQMQEQPQILGPRSGAQVSGLEDESEIVWDSGIPGRYFAGVWRSPRLSVAL
jgi:hypothetical protein